MRHRMDANSSSNFLSIRNKSFRGIKCDSQWPVESLEFTFNKLKYSSETGMGHLWWRENKFLIRFDFCNQLRLFYKFEGTFYVSSTVTVRWLPFGSYRSIVHCHSSAIMPRWSSFGSGECESKNDLMELIKSSFDASRSHRRLFVGEVNFLSVRIKFPECGDN